MGFYRYFYPFGLSSLASFLKEKGHQILIYDADHGEKPVSLTSSDMLSVFPNYLKGIQNLNHPIWKEVETAIKNYNPDLIGITFMSTKKGSVENIINISKKLYPQTLVVLGGAHPSILYKSSLEQTKADFVVIGEGEETFSELIDQVQNGRKKFEEIKGLAFKSKTGEIIRTSPRPLIEDLDTLPFPDRETLYKKETYRSDDLSMIMTSRGCPYNCTFCSSLWERRVRNRSIPNIIREIKYLISTYKTQNIYFKDDTFTINKKRISAFCDALEQENIKINWECLTRIELLDEELVLKMQKTGMNYLKIGIETGSPRLLKATNKNVTLEQIKRGAKLLNRLNQKWSAFFMIGFPDETEEEIFLTWKLIKEINPTYISMSILVPYPGCKDYYDLEKIGAIQENSNWNLYDPFSLSTHFTKNIEKEEFQELVIKTMKFVDDYNFNS